MIFVDTNIVIDLLETGSVWHTWSAGRIASAEDVVADAIVLAETAGKFGDVQAARSAFRRLDIVILPFSDDAGFRAGQAFLKYRKATGKREKILADFLIDAHAAALNIPLLTRDAGIYRTYFPELTLITPEDDHD